MKVQVEEISSCRKAIVVELPPEVVQEKMETVYRSLAREVKLPGFRKGKVPPGIVRQRFRDEARSEVLREIIPESYRQALREVQLSPVGEPDLEDVVCEEGHPLRYRAIVEVKPVVRVERYTGVEAVKEKITVSDEEVEKALEALRERAAEYVPMEGWPALRDDLVVIDYTGTIGGKVMAGGKGENVSLVLGARELLPGFEEQLLGMQREEEKEFSFLLPGDYPQRDLAGKRALFRVVMREVKKKRIPPLDDGFAKTVGECDTLRDLRDKVRQQISRAKEREQETLLKGKIMEKIAAAHPVEVPEVLVAAEAERILEEMSHSLAAQGVRVTADTAQADALRMKVREAATKRVRASLLLEAIAEQEGITVSGEETDAEVHALASSLNHETKALKDALERSGRLRGITALLRERKTLDFLYSQAKIAEGANLVTLA